MQQNSCRNSYGLADYPDRTGKHAALMRWRPVAGLFALVLLGSLAGAPLLSDLAASQRNGQIVRTTGPDPRHVCSGPGHPGGDDAESRNAPKHRAPGDETLRRLQQETRELLAEIGSGHRKLMRISPSLTPERHIFVLKDMAYELDQRSELVGERTIVAIRYDAARDTETPDCVILDHTLRNHDEPGRWIRRIARVRINPENQLSVHFETIAHNMHATLPLQDLERTARLRVSRRILSQLRDVQYVIDRTLPALSARSTIAPF